MRQRCPSFSSSGMEYRQCEREVLLDLVCRDTDVARTRASDKVRLMVPSELLAGQLIDDVESVLDNLAIILEVRESE